MVSIITITFNNFDDLVKTVNSVPKKKVIEHIIVNGGSCLKTKNYLKEFEGVYIDEPDEGISDAFNKGIKFSKGEFIMFLNSGDILIDKEYPEKAEEIMLENHQVDFVHSAIIFEEHMIGDITLYPKMDAELSSNLLGRYMPLRHQSMVQRKSLFDKIGCFNIYQKHAMDFDWVCRWSKINGKASYYKQSIPVKMDGTGRSSVQEFKLIIEISSSLFDNFGFNVPILLNLIIRWVFFLLRNLMIRLGMINLLLRLKAKKYKACSR